MGTVEVVEERVGTVKKITFEWESEDGGDDAGKASAATTYAYNGTIERLVTVPDATDAPSENYDVAVLDEDGVDVLMGAGANRHASNTEQVGRANLGVVANDKLTLLITDAGNAKKGTVYLYLR
jgi:hypothetical protein